ncbi:putative FBD-associated F-box protein At5g53635 isoform X2 [Arabidopsis lyrata subsp. lyrata]|uniref:putative FBD-associated F-box protein At5g53635 isoform X2 n=1 Tax=Arabidopsis lyrata subsp. lyrata TaxID=81972 RepID=UPI000A29C7F3|nr:putative FBD-associated F-box protein At5g53635 isoform X2 [Arabidopsis lyrata subsp. lyrata]|eukprot:XP_020878722.1 putative FBD-associated F-box protein At5g53635 isoform X2 [Arabidopsis lyrata subsp. lyrata]
MDGSKGLSTERLKEDRISQLPDPLICHILSHLPTKEAVTTSVLSTRWRSLWLWVPNLELDSRDFSDFNAFASFGDRFFDSDRVSCIHKLKLAINGNGDGVDDTSYIKSWIDAAVKRKVQHLRVMWFVKYGEMPLSFYVCETLVSLNLVCVALDDVEFVSFPRLKTMHLLCVRLSKDAAFERFISCCPVLEDLRIAGCVNEPLSFRVHSQSLKRLIIGRGILKVGDLTINSDTLKIIYDYSKSESLPQFGYMSRLCVSVMAQYLTWLEPFLKSCPNLRSLVLVFPNSLPERMNQINFSCVPKCLQSSVEFVDLKFQISGPVTEMKMKLVRYFLENSAILKKLTLHMYSNSTEDEILTKLLQIPRASTKCEVVIVIK